MSEGRLLSLNIQMFVRCVGLRHIMVYSAVVSFAEQKQTKVTDNIMQVYLK